MLQKLVKIEPVQKSPYISNKPKIKMVICPPTHNPRIFGMVKGTANIFHRAKNRVRRFCVGGDMAVLILGSFQKYGGFSKTRENLIKRVAVKSANSEENKLTISPTTHKPRTWFLIQ